MGKTIRFHKLSAAGNDFILIDNRKKILPRNLSAVAKKLCHRMFSVGADGIITLENSRKADFKMVYYNSDGSFAAMCGNGGRSVARFAHLIGAADRKMKFETAAGFVHAEILGKNIRLQLYEPKDTRLDLSLRVNGRDLGLSFIDTGVPHVVVIVNDIKRVDVAGLGRMIRFHKEFAPAGTNVNFIQKKNNNTLFVRTYERGVEGETLACGTGVTASAVIAALKGIVSVPVNCITSGGETLRVSFTKNDLEDFISPVSNLYLEGPAEVTFKGEVIV
ncbi:MAG: diaminopimelate epimerase [Endomicrobiales bacterium]|nr:diaminopimelate epimerase [Endomicrobiales bacterium]